MIIGRVRHKKGSGRRQDPGPGSTRWPQRPREVVLPESGSTVAPNFPTTAERRVPVESVRTGPGSTRWPRKTTREGGVRFGNTRRTVGTRQRWQSASAFRLLATNYLGWHATAMPIHSTCCYRSWCWCSASSAKAVVTHCFIACSACPRDHGSRSFQSCLPARFVVTAEWCR